MTNTEQNKITGTVNTPNMQGVNNQNEADIHNKKKRRMLLIGSACFFLLIFLIYIAYYFLVLEREESTDDAYVGGNMVYITPQVNGTIAKIYVDNTDFVEEGSIIMQLDPIDNEMRLKQSEANLANAVRKLQEQYDMSSRYDSIIAQSVINVKKAEDEYARRLPLLKNKVISDEEVFNAKKALELAKANLESTVKQADSVYALTAGVELKNHPSIIEAKANFVEAWLAVKRTKIVSPVSGYVAQRKAQVGVSIASGNPQMAVVPLHDLWIDANFKETDIKNIRIGQPVKITADVYGSSVKYNGKILGISSGTGSAFSLLPAQNATGNWIKVIQRVPVRVSLDKKDLERHPLRIGLSTVVTVDTSNRSGEMLSLKPVNKVIYETNTLQEPMEEAASIADNIINQNSNYSKKSDFILNEFLKNKLNKGMQNGK